MYLRGTGAIFRTHNLQESQPSLARLPQVRDKEMGCVYSKRFLVLACIRITLRACLNGVLGPPSEFASVGLVWGQLLVVPMRC